MTGEFLRVACFVPGGGLAGEIAMIAHINPKSPSFREWCDVFGAPQVPVQAPVPVEATVCGETRQVYLVALDRLSIDQMARLIDHLSRKFGETREEVAAELKVSGLPLLADDVTVPIDLRHII